jgi:hypothetical protein
MPIACIRSALCLGLAAPFAAAQCVTTWQPGAPIPGVNGPVDAMAPWDPDGPGPLPERLVLGGDFSIAGNVVCENVAIFDPASGQWSAPLPMGAQPDRRVTCTAVLPNGEFVVGMAGQTLPWDAPVFRGNGAGWTPLGSVSGDVAALAVLPNGDLIAGGYFTPYPSGLTMCLGRWTGTTWVPFAGDVGGSVRGLLVTNAGDLIVTGFFTTAGGVPAARIARWNGITWSAFGSGLNAVGYCLCERPNGDIVVGGQFTTAGGSPTNQLARWDGVSWSAIGSQLSGAINALANDPVSGALLAGGSISLVGVPANIAAWNGSTWSTFAAGVGGQVRCVHALANGRVAVGGTFGHASGTESQNFGLWSGSQWLALGPPAASVITRLAEMANGDVVAAGSWSFGSSPDSVARQVGGVWTPLGTGVNMTANAVLAMPNGDLIAGGWFTIAGGASANRIARWNGTTWSPLGTGLDGPVHDLARLPNGDVVATGSFTTAGGVAASNIARWNGSTWAPLGGGLTGPSGSGRFLVVLPAGDLVVAGTFTAAGGIAANNVARWNGSTWSSMGAGLGWIKGLAVTPNGDVLAAALSGAPSGALQRWNGIAWQPLPPLPPWTFGAEAVAVLPDGSVVGALTDGGFSGPYPILRLTGSSWSQVGSANDVVVTFLCKTNGDLLAGGAFSRINQLTLPRLGRLSSSCPALATTTGAGCASSGGANLLAATSLPWIGGTLVTAGSGLPGNALVVVARGFAPIAVPLPQLLPQGQPGCVLHIAPDNLTMLVPVNGAATASLAIPPALALIGLACGEQWVPLELGTGAAIVAATSTNLLSLTIGVF